jgi:hypothetical protein
MRLPVMATLVSLLWVAPPTFANADALDGKLTPKAIKKVMKKRSKEVARCYKRFALRQRRATGRVKLELIVERDGSVRVPKKKGIKIKAPGVRGKRFYKCVTKRVRRWQFPEIDFPTDVVLPFYFQHTRRR